MMTQQYPELDFLIEPDKEGYISEESLDLILSLSKEGLLSQIDGVKQMTARCGSMLTQSISLTSASVGAAYLALNNNSAMQMIGTKALLSALGAATALWAISSVFAALGMLGKGYSAPGIDAIDGYKKEILGINIRQSKAWAIQIIGNTKDSGIKPSNRLKMLLNISIWSSIAAPISAILAGAAML